MAEKVYIEREAAISELQRWGITADRPRTWMNAIDKAIEVVKAIPAADVRPVVRGEWMPTGAGCLTSKCSVCGNKSLETGNFCPNCGASMED